ncbi:hypothetical protein HDF26_001329 [Pedobacter cryoconitis]|nr:hypothetical protein [Pedobacter cryoconitis]
MKNLRLKALGLGATEVLTRAQLKKVRGSGGSSDCIKNEYYGCQGSSRKCCDGCTCKTVSTPEGTDSQCQGTCAYT